MKAVIFDLDNTLFDVKQYFSGAFSDIATYLKEKHHLSSIEIYKRLMATWNEKTSMYAHLFDDLLGELGLDDELEKIVQIFNEYEGELKPYSDTIPLLTSLQKAEIKLGIITDGNPQRQMRKIRLLDISRFFDVIILTKELGQSKLTEDPFRKALHELGTIPECSLYVGDNPHLDFKGAKHIGLKTVRLMKGEFKNMSKNEYIDYEINELKELTGFFDE
jgi:putative hydrolase of the HAD superfamily